MNASEPLHVVFGASGGAGNALVRELADRGRRVRAVSRRVADAPPGVEIVHADAAVIDDARAAAEGASVVYNCVNVPYARWAEFLPPLWRNVTAAASASGAKLVVMDCLCTYGPSDVPLVETTPYRATGKKGRTRIAMIEELLAPRDASDVRVAVGRAADFYGRGVRLALYGESVFRAAMSGRTIRGAGSLNAPHVQSYVADVARGLAVLGERDEATGEIWHLPVAPAISQRMFMELIFMEADQLPGIGRLPSLGLHMVGLFNANARELLEFNYQYERPFEVDSSKFERAFGVTATPYREAIRETIAWCRANPLY
jgi:nucleoside-diphosphate-sugar epimerase